MSGEPLYNRVLLKISGEALGGKAGFGLETETLDYIAKEIIAVHQEGVEVAVVVGGGNFIRGSAFSVEGGIDRTVADQMGMLGTIMNGLALQAAIEANGVPTRVQSAITVSEVAEPFIRRRAVRHLEKGRVIVFTAGTGNPYFTTDTASVLRALEIDAKVIFKATKVDGIYDKDPKKHADAVKYNRLTFGEALEQQLGVMDQTAFAMCREHKLRVVVMNLRKAGSMVKAVRGETIGTLVEGD
ncbi:MAG: UMP kinase [Fimbriimonadaceae bacterium]|jgi:uridylate kinase|nr:UMP kinase [Fimbriimonadaceae bacterium]